MPGRDFAPNQRRHGAMLWDEQEAHANEAQPLTPDPARGF